MFQLGGLSPPKQLRGAGLVLIVKIYFWLLSKYWVQSYICCGDFS